MTRALALLSVVVLLVFGLCAATQYVAVRLPPAATLGSRCASIGGQPLYAPWAWISWSHEEAPRHPDLFRTAGDITTLGALAGAAVAAIARGMVRRGAAPSRSHGSSRWATTAEIEAAGLLREEGVVLCQTSDARCESRVDRMGRLHLRPRRFGRLVRHDGPEHVLCFAPTGSGKGVGLVVPTLLTWPHSALVYDIKRENWDLTAGWRRKFSRVWRFEPTAADSVRFNPLLEVRRGASEVKDVQNIADMLVDPAGERESRDHWQTTAHGLLSGALLHVLYAEPDKSLSGVAAFLSDPGRTHAQTLQRMLEASHLPTGPHPVVAQLAREAANRHEKELSSVWSTALSFLGLYRDPVVARNTGESDFRIRDLVCADTPVTLYIVVPPSDLSRTRPLVRLMLNQIGRRLTESMQVADRHRLLLLLDEFPALGRLDFFESALAFIRGYRMKAMLIVQDLNQLEKAYGANSSILGNCGVRFAYAANDDRTAKRISDMLGQCTESKVQKSFSGSGVWLSNRTETQQEFGRPLLTPGEVTQLPVDEGLLLVGGMQPYRGRKVRFFMDPRLAGRAALPRPDDPLEQTRELLASGASEWREHIVPSVSNQIRGTRSADASRTPIRSSVSSEKAAILAKDAMVELIINNEATESSG